MKCIELMFCLVQNENCCPDNFLILVRSGHLARKSGQRNKALIWFRLAQTKASSPTHNLQSFVFITEELRALDLLDEASELLEFAISEYPDDLRFLLIRGDIYRRENNLFEAAKIYRQILSTEPNHFEARFELAKIYGQLGQEEKAISLLEKTNQLLGANIKTYIQLGFYNEALENWSIAETWYRKACQEYPENPQGYCRLANLLSLQGNSDAAVELLQKAQVRLPHISQIAHDLIELQLRLGNIDLSCELAVQELKRFPHNQQLSKQFCRLEIKRGEYFAAEAALDRISTDSPMWLRQAEQLRTTICFLQYDYKKAESHIRKAIALTSVAVAERIRLASLFCLTGRIEQAHQQLKIATEELMLKGSAGVSIVPLKSTTAMIVNLLRINPPLKKQLLLAQQKAGWERMVAFKNLLAQEPNYFGSALYLARELRQQGIFDRLQQALANQSTKIPPIPQRIVQFWDNPEPPPEVLRICQSWSDLNPEYEHLLFSVDTAVSFLEEHYNLRVIKAFINCEHPATQADFFRLAYLNKMGGFYADVDDLCLQSLDSLIDIRPELVILQEDVVTFGNNFLGCIPGQSMIQSAFNRAVDNLVDYCNESPWSATGPGLITSAICHGLIPYLGRINYPMCPRLLVLNTAQFKKIVNSHMALPYKKTDKSWSYEASRRRIKAVAI